MNYKYEFVYLFLTITFVFNSLIIDGFVIISCNFEKNYFDEKYEDCGHSVDYGLLN